MDSMQVPSVLIYAFFNNHRLATLLDSLQLTSPSISRHSATFTRQIQTLGKRG